MSVPASGIEFPSNFPISHHRKTSEQSQSRPLISTLQPSSTSAAFGLLHRTYIRYPSLQGSMVSLLLLMASWQDRELYKYQDRCCLTVQPVPLTPSLSPVGRAGSVARGGLRVAMPYTHTHTHRRCQNVCPGGGVNEYAPRVCHENAAAPYQSSMCQCTIGNNMSAW